MPILVAGQHYRTTEASNGSPAEKHAIGYFFMLGGAAAMLYEFIHMLCLNKYELQVHILSASNKGNAIVFDSSRV